MQFSSTPLTPQATLQRLPQAKQPLRQPATAPQAVPLQPREPLPSFGFVEGLLETIGIIGLEIVEWEVISRVLQAPLAFIGEQLSRFARCLSHQFEQWFGRGQPPKPSV
jgi:hypothetical protein